MLVFIVSFIALLKVMPQVYSVVVCNFTDCTRSESISWSSKDLIYWILELFLRPECYQYLTNHDYLTFEMKSIINKSGCEYLLDLNLKWIPICCAESRELRISLNRTVELLSWVRPQNGLGHTTQFLKACLVDFYQVFS